MTEDLRPTEFVDLPRNCFPLLMEFYTPSDNKVFHTITVDEPGAVEIPSKSQFGITEEIEVRVFYADGVVRTSEGQED